MQHVEKLVSNTSAQMRKGILEFCILLILSKEKRYASDILKGLKEADLLVVEGTLYPLLNRLKRSEVLAYEWEESPNGPPRKYYTLTKTGEQLLKELLPKWNNLSTSINQLSEAYE